jgi:hypothetical protein
VNIEDFNEYKDFVRGKDGPQLANNKSYLKLFVEWTGLIIDEAERDRTNPTRGIK